MKQEDKDLLLKDLCARLPYGVKIAMPGLWDSKITIEPLNEIFKGDDGLFRVNGNGHCIEYIKPYLFPLSSMTDEQKKEYALVMSGNNLSYSHLLGMSAEDWFNKNHFDYRGLIDKGLAIDCTNLKIY